MFGRLPLGKKKCVPHHSGYISAHDVEGAYAESLLGFINLSTLVDFKKLEETFGKCRSQNSQELFGPWRSVIAGFGSVNL